MPKRSKGKGKLVGYACKHIRRDIELLQFGEVPDVTREGRKIILAEVNALDITGDNLTIHRQK